MEPAAGGTLLIIGAGCLVAALVGGNVSLPGGTRFEALNHRGVRVLLALAGAFLGLVGLLLILPASAFSPAPQDSAEYVAEANEICDEGAKEVARLDVAPAAEEDPDRLEDYLIIMDNTHSQVLALGSPSSDVDIAWQHHADYLQAFGEYISAARANNDSGRYDAGSRASQAQRAFNASARELGLVACIFR